MFASVVYTKPVKKLIASFKYKPYLSHLQELLGTLFIEGIIQEEPFMSILSKDTVLIPIPLHRTKQKQRGYNHAALLSTHLSSYFRLPVFHSLIRTKQTTSQFGLTRNARKENLNGAFSLTVQPSFSQVILIDDIVTSGTTFLEAAKVLKKSGVAKVYGIALAHGR